MKATTDAQRSVDEFIQKADPKFQPICKKLRSIFVREGLIEEIKWGAPCYSHQGLVCSIGAFKKHAGTWFFKGALLNDPNKRLRKAQKETKGLRGLIFTDAAQLDEYEIRQFVKQAMILNEQGISVPGIGKKKPLVIPDLLQSAFDADPAVAQKFEEFNLTRKREFTEWIAEAKRQETKQRRLEQALDMIKKGIGRHDKYR